MYLIFTFKFLQKSVLLENFILWSYTWIPAFSKYPDFCFWQILRYMLMVDINIYLTRKHQHLHQAITQVSAFGRYTCLLLPNDLISAWCTIQTPRHLLWADTDLNFEEIQDQEICSGQIPGCRYLDICLNRKPLISGYLLWVNTGIFDLGRYPGIYLGQIPRYLLGQIPKCML